jgi:hypothetical protein
MHMNEKENSPLPLPIPNAVRLYGTALITGGLAYIGLVLFVISRGVRGGIPNLAFGLVMAQTGRQFRRGKRAGVLWLASWLVLGPVYLFGDFLSPAQTEMAAILALLGIPAIVIAIHHWERFS